MKHNERPDKAVEQVEHAAKRISQTNVPIVPDPASRFDVIKSTATTVTAVAAACAVLYSGGDALFTRYAAAAERKAEDAGHEAKAVAEDLAAYKKEIGARLDRIEAKQDEAVRRSESQARELYQAVMFSRRSQELEAPPRDGGK